MKGKIEWIRVSAMVHSTEDREKVSQALATIFPFEFEIMITKATGHYGNPIEYLEVELKKNKEIQDFWKNLMNLLGVQREEIISSLEDRIDEQNVFHIRLDKQKAYLGEVKLASRGDAIAIKAKLVTFPAKREKVIEFAKELCMIS